MWMGEGIHHVLSDKTIIYIAVAISSYVCLYIYIVRYLWYLVGVRDSEVDVSFVDVFDLKICQMQMGSSSQIG